MVAIKVGIMGAGSIGAYLGARCINGGLDTVLVGRPALGADIARHGLRVTDLRGADFRLRPSQVRYATDPAALADRDIVFVTVKSAATAEAAEQLRAVLPAGAAVVSFQNGVRNAGVLREHLPGARVLAGMVPYNVVWQDEAHFHCGTSGALLVEDQGEPTAQALAALRRAGLEADGHADLPGILWGKLIFNLNNPINALADIPLREELAQRGYRRIIAAAMDEALAVLRLAGIRPARSGKLIPGLAPRILRLPNRLFFRVAASMIKIDPRARSSMWEDLQRGRVTEVDYINGEVVALAARHGGAAPVNAGLVALIRQAERAGTPGLSAAGLGDTLGIGNRESGIRR
jgi:2-dehydropantoate 2-reductase